MDFCFGVGFGVGVVADEIFPSFGGFRFVADCRCLGLVLGCGAVARAVTFRNAVRAYAVEEG